MAAWITRASGTAEALTPRTNTRPSSISMSASAASSSAAAAVTTLARTAPAASAIELPAVTAAAAGEGADAERHRGRVAAHDGDVLERDAEHVGADLRERRLVALAGAHRAGGDDGVAGQVERHPRALEGADGGALDVAGDADAPPDTARAQRRLLAPERVVAGRVQRCVQHRAEVAAVVHERVAVAVRHAEVPRQLGGGEVVAPADLGGVEPELAGEAVDRAVHREHRLRPAGPAVRRVRRLVRDRRPAPRPTCRARGADRAGARPCCRAARCPTTL